MPQTGEPAKDIPEFLKRHPHGRSHKRMSKGAARKQAIAAALEAQRRKGKRKKGYRR